LFEVQVEVLLKIDFLVPEVSERILLKFANLRELDSRGIRIISERQPETMNLCASVPDEVHVGIIGAGAAGLSAAYYLQKLSAEGGLNKKLKITFLEARDRIGGRILTTEIDGKSLVQGTTFTGDPVNNADESQCNVLEFGPQWAHDVGDEGHALRPFVGPVGIQLSEPELYTFAHDTNTLIFTHEDFPSVTNKEQAELDLWMEDIVADTVLRYDIFFNHGDKIFPSHGEVFKKTFPAVVRGAAGASVEEIVDMALSAENIARWWTRRRNGKVHSGPVTPLGRSGSNAEDRTFAEDFAELPDMPEAVGHLKRLMSLPEHYQEEETDDFLVPYPSAPLLRLARRLLLVTFSSYYGLHPRNIGYASLESQVEHSEEHRVVRNGYARLVSFLSDQISLRNGDLTTNADASRSPASGVAAADAAVYMNRSVTSITETEDGIRVLCKAGGQGEWSLSGHCCPPAADDAAVREEYRFDHVVCTLPLGVLKSVCPPELELEPSSEGTANNDGETEAAAPPPSAPSFFTPPLPRPIANSISRLEMGLLNKLVVLWDNAEEWEQVNLQRRFVYPGDHDKTFCMCINLCSDTMHSRGLRGYCMYSSPPFAEQVEMMDHEAQVDMAMEIIATGKQELLRRDSEKHVGSAAGGSRILPAAAATATQSGRNKSNKGGIPALPPSAPATDNKMPTQTLPLPRPNRVYTTRWSQDPCSLGAYSCMPKKGSLADFDAFAAPHGHVHFAGEHTQSSDFGCVHAAIETGKRAASAILRDATPKFF
jgi:hypothetical protein